jgi:FKBP-type peptidyl-prolyl cis-trans isomerase
VRGASEGEIRRITIHLELASGSEDVVGLFGPRSAWSLDTEIVEVVRNRTI